MNKAIDFTSSPTEGLVARQGQYTRWKEEVVDSKKTQNKENSADVSEQLELAPMVCRDNAGLIGQVF